MLTSLALVFLAGLAAAAVCSAIKLPRIIGMLLVGIVLGPHILNVLDDSILSISSELRQMALIIILLKAGLSLNLSDLRQVGRPAVLLSCLPATCELAGYILLAPYLLGVNRIEAAVMGAVLAAVSPAVVVPRMVFLMENRWGTDKSIPQMLLAGASCDDIYVIVLFTTFTGIAQGGNARAADFLNIPVSIVLGIAVGAAAGYALSRFFEAAFARNHMVRGSVKVIIVLSVSFLLVALETVLKGRIALSGLLAVTSMACMLARKTTGEVRARLSEKFGKLWIAAELILFVLVGAAVDIQYVSETGLAAVLMVFAALIFRAAGVVLCLAGTKLSRRERLFCVIAYLPKATVQAAIGSVPLAMGLPCGKIVLSVTVLAIFDHCAPRRTRHGCSIPETAEI